MKPCPYCKHDISGDFEWVEGEWVNPKNSRDYCTTYAVGCPHCEMHGPLAKSKEKAKRVWEGNMTVDKWEHFDNWELIRDYVHVSEMIEYIESAERDLNRLNHAAFEHETRAFVDKIHEEKNKLRTIFLQYTNELLTEMEKRDVI